MRLRSTDGVELALHDLGGDGPSLVLGHATGFHGRTWGRLGPALASRFHCWSLDFRGHGESTRPEPPEYPWRGFGDDVLAVVANLGGDQPFGFGHSQGGTALLLAEQARPGTFRALYLYEPVAFPAEPPPPSLNDHPLVVGALRRRGVFESAEAALCRLGARPPLADFDPDALRDYVEHGVQPLPGGGFALRCRPDDEAQIYRMGLVNRAFDHLGDVACPVTVAVGARSPSVGEHLGLRQVARLPAGRLEVLDGLDHFGPLEEPGRVATSAVRALLGA